MKRAGQRKTELKNDDNGNIDLKEGCQGKYRIKWTDRTGNIDSNTSKYGKILGQY